jgi:transmembrane sensor
MTKPAPDDPLDGLAEHPTGIAWQTDALWSRIRADTIEGPAGTPVPVKPPRRAWHPRHRVAFIAGGIAVAAAILFMAVVLSIGAKPSRPDREYATATAERATIHLSDGSVVILAPRSRLLVPDNFGAGSRQLTLVGRASFDVVHDSAAPLSVRAGAAIVKDIGTHFSVSAYPDESVAVDVTEGEALLSGASGEPVHLMAGSAGVVASKTSAAQRGVAVRHSRDWETGRLTFDNEPLRAVLNTLERWYDIDIRADAIIADRRVTAVFTADRPAEMIDALALAVDARVSRTGKVVVLTGAKP